MQEKELESLSVLDISFLLEKPPSEVSSLLKLGVSKIRSDVYSLDLALDIGPNFDVLTDLSSKINPFTSEIILNGDDRLDTSLWELVYLIESRFQNHIEDVMSFIEDRGLDLSNILGIDEDKINLIKLELDL